MKRITGVCICKALVVLLAVSFCLGISVISVQAEVKNDAPDIININTATVKEIMALPGIGKKKAEAIFAYRQDKGRFDDIAGLKKVDGVGKKTYEKIKAYVVAE